MLENMPGSLTPLLAAAPVLATTDGATAPLVTDPAGVLAVLLAVLAGIFWMTQHQKFGRLFKVVPALVFCYFVPTALTTLGVLPDQSALYTWFKTFVLPASLLSYRRLSPFSGLARRRRQAASQESGWPGSGKQN